jgi:hypothetical protein
MLARNSLNRLDDDKRGRIAICRDEDCRLSDCELSDVNLVEEGTPVLPNPKRVVRCTMMSLERGGMKGDQHNERRRCCRTHENYKEPYEFVRDQEDGWRAVE